VITLHIQFRVKPGRENQFEELYWITYVPVISKQEGFRRTQMLRPYGGGNEYEIDIYFDTEDLRERWASSPDHERVWPQVEDLCTEIAPRGFEVLAED
jgi:antibiotic biosynthesis monooxygenase (ABM) superfamily enzyme